MTRYTKAPNPTRRTFGLLMAFLLVASLLPLVAVTGEPVAASPDPDWWDSNWIRRKPITITAGANGVPENYQISVLLTYDSDMGFENFQDSRFLWENSSGNYECPFWFEKVNSGENVENAWIKLPDDVSLVADQSCDNLKWYYGNASAGPAENGDATFMFFDDFDDNSLDGAKWATIETTVSEVTQRLRIQPTVTGGAGVKSVSTLPTNNIIIEADFTLATLSSNYHQGSLGFYDTVIGDDAYVGRIYESAQKRHIKVDGTHYGLVADSTTSGHFKAVLDGSNLFTGYIKATAGTSGAYTTVGSETWTHTNTYAWVRAAYSGADVYFDDVIVRKYADPEPTASAGAEESEVNPPEKPVLISPENNYSTPDNTLTFVWENGVNATSHRLVIDNDSTFSDGDNIYDNASAWDNSGMMIENELPPDNYWWKVCATNANGDNWSENTWTFEITSIVNVAPNKPTNLQPTGAQTTTSITISCVATDNDGDDMNVHFYDNSDNSLIDNIWIENGQTAQVTWDGLAHGQMYVFFAGVQDNNGNWGENSDTQSFWVILHGPERDKPIENQPYFEWSDSYADNYRLLVDNNQDFSSPVENRVLTENHYWIPAENALENGVWYWMVIAYFDGETAESDMWSFVVGTVGGVEAEGIDLVAAAMFLFPIVLMIIALAFDNVVFASFAGIVFIFSGLYFIDIIWLAMIFIGIGIYLLITALMSEED